MAQETQKATQQDIPYDKTFDLVPDKVDEPMPGVRRVLCNNPSPFTYKGTVSYIVGRGKVAIIDPGPVDAAHSAALLDAVRGETVTHIFVTHTHRDHSPGVPAIKAATGALVLAEGPHRPARAAACRRRAADRGLQRHRLHARPRARRWRGGARRRLDAGSHHHAGPHRQPHGLCLQGEQHRVLRRSRHGVVDAGGGAAGRLDGRLHGLAAEARQAHRAGLFPGPRRCGEQRAALRRCLYPASQGPRGRRSSTGCRAARATSRRSSPRSTPISIRGCSRLPACRCWRIWRTWSPAAPSPPTARPRSPAATGWREPHGRRGGLSCPCLSAWRRPWLSTAAAWPARRAAPRARPSRCRR